MTFHTLTTKLIYIFLLAVCYLYLYFTPHSWQFSNDDGMYIASAESMLKHFQYTYNRLPNLLVYPGTSTVIAAVFFIFGYNFFVLHLVFVLLSIINLFLVFKLLENYHSKLTALFITAIFSINHFSLMILYTIRSEQIFMLLSFSAFLCWRQYIKTENIRLLGLCLFCCAYIPLVRFQGLLLCAAFFLAYLVQNKQYIKNIKSLFFKVTLVLLPFALWTWRNYLNYTPEAHNIFLNMFFKMPGEAHYAPETSSPEHDALFYSSVRLGILLKHFIYSLFGESIYLAYINYIYIASIVTPCIFLLGYIGFKNWFKKANAFEATYFLIHAAFLIVHSILRYGHTTSSGLLPHYWLPLLPFILSILFNALDSLKIKITPPAGIVFKTIGICVLSFMLIIGMQRLLAFDNQDYQQYWKEKQEFAHTLKRYVQQHIPKDSLIMTTDIGFAAYFFERKSINMLDSLPSALNQIQNQKPQYLIAFFSTQMGIMAYQNYDYRSHQSYQTIESIQQKQPKILFPLLQLKSTTGANHAVIYKILSNFHIDNQLQPIQN